ncbi:MAG: RIP metalloprotease RseP [Acholeplasmataceae bacterium]|nr:RIP metalloprotease RseP [Acholeplasmataceae bacterium]
MVLFNLLIFVIVLGTIILVHEFGHFYFAKRAGILCHEFSIGMGPALWQKRKGETVYSIRGIPIGGYVSMAGESISDAMVKKGQAVGLKTNEQGKVTHIFLYDDPDATVAGVVGAFDLYGKDLEPLFIELETGGTTTRYEVLRHAQYAFSKKKSMWVTPAEKSFESKTLFERFLVIFAGPFMNFVLAIVLFAVVGFFVEKPMLETTVVDEISEGLPASLAGLPEGAMIKMIAGTETTSWTDLDGALKALDTPIITVEYEVDGIAHSTEMTVLVDVLTAGFSNYTMEGNDLETLEIYADEPIIGIGNATRAATDGNMKTGDLITKIQSGETVVDIDSWDDIIAFFRTNDRGEVTITYVRGDEVKEGTYTLISNDAITKLGRTPMQFVMGVSPESDFDLLYTLAYPFESVYANTMSVFRTIGLLADPNEDLGFGDLSGPVGIFSLVSNTASQGILSLVGFTAFLSINIGLLNLLPIPALDGGRLVFLGVEGIIRKPLNRRLENTINNLMFFLLLGLFVYVTFNDIVRLIKG